MPTDPSQGDSTDGSLAYNYSKYHFAPAEADSSVIALEIQRLHAIAGLLNPNDPSQPSPQVEVASDYQSDTSVAAPNSYSGATDGDPDSIEIRRDEPYSTVIVSATASTSDVDFQLREAPESEGNMATGASGWHQLDETNVAAGASYKARFDLSGRAVNFRFREGTTDGDATVDYDITLV